MTSIYNKSDLKSYRRDLRRRATSYEKLLWKYLRKRQLLNFRFLRQYSIGRFIVDFYCPEARLVIELDGSQHIDNAIYDKASTIYFYSLGIKVLRFQNSELKSIKNVLTTIVRSLPGQLVNKT